MKEFKGTPRPWQVEYDNDDFHQWNTIGPAKIEYAYKTPFDELLIIESDIKLIAAAPDLFKACEIILDAQTNKEVEAAKKEAYLAINKALNIKP